MSYELWKLIVRKNKWSLAELRCDVRPSKEMLAVMDEMGLDRWEKFVLRL